MMTCPLIKHNAMKKYERKEAELHKFLLSALDAGEWSASRPGYFTPWRRHPRYPLNRRLGGCSGEKKNPLPPPPPTNNSRNEPRSSSL